MLTLDRALAALWKPLAALALVLFAAAAATHLSWPPTESAAELRLGNGESARVFVVHWGTLAAMLLGFAGLGVAALAFGAWLNPLRWFQLRLAADSRVDFRLDESLPVEVDLDTTVSVPLAQDLPVEIPIRQHLHARLPHAIRVPLDIELDVPLDETVHVRAGIPVDTAIKLDTVVWTRVGPLRVPIPLKARVPLQTVIPVDSQIRIRVDDLRVKIRREIEVTLTDPIPVEVDETFKLVVPLNAEVRAPVRQRIASEVNIGASRQVSFAGDIHVNSSNIGVVRKR